MEYLVTPGIQYDKLLISGNSKDALQEAHTSLREHDQDLPLRFTNYK
jgi:uncharacterized protein YajQ (UPF0234 family)